MTPEEQEQEQALFEMRVKQINRDCLKTFLPYIKLVIGILMFIGSSFLALTIHFYGQTTNKIDHLNHLFIEDNRELGKIQKQLETHEDNINFIKNVLFK